MATYRFEGESEEERRIARIRERFELGTGTDVIRLALRRLDEERTVREHRAELLLERLQRLLRLDLSAGKFEYGWSEGMGRAFARVGDEEYVDSPGEWVWRKDFAQDGGPVFTRLEPAGERGSGVSPDSIVLPPAPRFE